MRPVLSGKGVRGPRGPLARMAVTLAAAAVLMLALTPPAHGGVYGAGSYGAGAYGVGAQVPTLTFAVSGLAGGASCNGHVTTHSATATAIGFGRLATTGDVSVAQRFEVDTNAAAGYTVSVAMPVPLAAGSREMTSVAGSNANPGAFAAASGGEALGYTTDDATLGTGVADRFTLGGPLWAALSPTHDEVMYSPGPSTAASPNCVVYRLQTAETTPAGLYSALILYRVVSSF